MKSTTLNLDKSVPYHLTTYKSANHSYFEDDVAHLYRKVHKDTTNIPKTKNADNIAPPNIIFSILYSLYDTII